MGHNTLIPSLNRVLKCWFEEQHKSVDIIG